MTWLSSRAYFIPQPVFALTVLGLKVFALRTTCTTKSAVPREYPNRLNLMNQFSFSCIV